VSPNRINTLWIQDAGCDSEWRSSGCMLAKSIITSESEFHYCLSIGFFESDYFVEIPQRQKLPPERG